MPFLLIYRNDPMFSDRYAWANSADPDQSSLIRVYTVCHSLYFYGELEKGPRNRGLAQTFFMMA